MMIELEEDNLAEVIAQVHAEKFIASRKLATVNQLPTFASFKKGVLLSQVQTNKEEQLKILIDEATAN